MSMNYHDKISKVEQQRRPNEVESLEKEKHNCCRNTLEKFISGDLKQTKGVVGKSLGGA